MQPHELGGCLSPPPGTWSGQGEPPRHGQTPQGQGLGIAGGQTGLGTLLRGACGVSAALSPGDRQLPRGPNSRAGSALPLPVPPGGRGSLPSGQPHVGQSRSPRGSGGPAAPPASPWSPRTGPRVWDWWFLLRSPRTVQGHREREGDGPRVSAPQAGGRARPWGARRPSAPHTQPPAAESPEPSPGHHLPHTAPSRSPPGSPKRSPCPAPPDPGA